MQTRYMNFLSAHDTSCLSLSLYIYTKVSGSGEGLRTGIQSFWGLQSFRAFQCSARPELLKIAQRAPRAAQSRSESLRACPEPLRAAQSVRSELFEEPLCVAQSRSESPRAVAQSCSKNRSGSLVSRALCISDAQFYLTWFSLLRACICTGSH